MRRARIRRRRGRLLGLDLIGKAIGRPVYDLLGGEVRDCVPFSAYLFYKRESAGGELGFAIDPKATGWDAARQAAALTPDGIVARAQAMCREFGFKSLKFKRDVRAADRSGHDLCVARGVRPGTPLRLDPNAVWSVETAIWYGRQMEGVLEYLEDPTRGQAAMAQVAQAVNIPAGDEHVHYVVR